jgi:hypothetical protein
MWPSGPLSVAAKNLKVAVDVFLLAGYDGGMTDSSTHRPKDPWDRRREESETAYHAFECYLSLPPGQRTLKAAYRLHTGNENAAGPSDHFKGLARRHDWEERAAAWDDAKAKARSDGILKGIEKQWEKMATKVEREMLQTFELSEKLYEKAQAILDQELTKDNYSMTHAVQMAKFKLEFIKVIWERMEHEKPEESVWGEVDDERVAQIVEDLRADEAASVFEEAYRRAEDEGP